MYPKPYNKCVRCVRPQRSEHLSRSGHKRCGEKDEATKFSVIQEAGTCACTDSNKQQCTSTSSNLYSTKNTLTNLPSKFATFGKVLTISQQEESKNYRVPSLQLLRHQNPTARPNEQIIFVVVD